MREKPFTNLFELVDAAAGALAPYMDRPFALFGHSMGAMISFELARYLRRTGRKEPHALVPVRLSCPSLRGHARRNLRPARSGLHRRTSAPQGTPAEVLDHPELLQLILPLLRADFGITQTYMHRPETPLSCPLTIFGGLEDDDATRENLNPWRAHTTAGFSLHMLPGDHFFLNMSQNLLLGIVGRELRRNSGATLENAPQRRDT